jgi:spermidine/putrescine-binding protein
MGVVNHRHPMIYPTADRNGTISWEQAIVLVADTPHPQAVVAFLTEYCHLKNERIDLGELEDWMSHQTMEAIADLIFSR